MNDRWLIRNAELTNEGHPLHADLRVRDGRITFIGANLTSTRGERVCDASGMWLLPRMIDDDARGLRLEFQRP